MCVSCALYSLYVVFLCTLLFYAFFQMSSFLASFSNFSLLSVCLANYFWSLPKFKKKRSHNRNSSLPLVAEVCSAYIKPYLRMRYTRYVWFYLYSLFSSLPYRLYCRFCYPLLLKFTLYKLNPYFYCLPLHHLLTVHYDSHLKILARTPP